MSWSTESPSWAPAHFSKAVKAESRVARYRTLKWLPTTKGPSRWRSTGAGAAAAPGGPPQRPQMHQRRKRACEGLGAPLARALLCGRGARDSGARHSRESKLGRVLRPRLRWSVTRNSRMPLQ
eukprot:6159192-Alexandrium_andersonii.AAC.2